jgi:hypothetical protein
VSQCGFVGRFFDAHGPTPLIVVGGFFIVISDMMTSLSKEYYQLMLSQGILLGAGCGIVYASFDRNPSVLIPDCKVELTEP